jgi:hypothetical protein
MQKKGAKHIVPTPQSLSGTQSLPTPSTLSSDPDGFVRQSDFQRLLKMVQDLSGHHAILKHSVGRLEDQVTTMQEGMETFGRVLNALRPQDSEAAGWTSNLQFPFSSSPSPIELGPSALNMPMDSPILTPRNPTPCNATADNTTLHWHRTSLLSYTSGTFHCGKARHPGHAAHEDGSAHPGNSRSPHVIITSKVMQI